MENDLVTNIKSIGNLVSEQLIQLQEKHGDSTVKTGFDTLDKRFGGFGLGEFVVIGGRPSMGKTQLLVNLSLNISKTVPVLYFNFDMSTFHLTNRFLSACLGIPAQKILQQQISDEDRKAVSVGHSKLCEHSLYITDKFSDSMPELREVCKKEVEEKGVKVIFVDGLQMMSTEPAMSTRELEISAYCRVLKRIAQDLNVCVVATSQLNRAVETRGGPRIPQLSDLRDSGAIEQEADKVIFLYRHDYYGFVEDEEGKPTEGKAEMIIAKNKNGKLGSVMIERDEEFTSFKGAPMAGA